MAPVRILLAELPQLLRDVIRELMGSRPDACIVGEMDNGVELLVAVKETNADAVIVGLQDGALPGISSHLVNEYPHLTVAGVSPDGRRAIVFRLRPHQVNLNDLSLTGLVDAIWTTVRGAEA